MGYGSHQQEAFRRSVRAAAGPRLHRDLRRNCRRDGGLAAVASPPATPSAADAIERAAFDGVLLSSMSADGDRLLVARQSAPAAEAHTGRSRFREQAAQAVVRLRLLPAEPRADFQLAAGPRDERMIWASQVHSTRPARSPPPSARSAAGYGWPSRRTTVERAGSGDRGRRVPADDWTLTLQDPRLGNGRHRRLGNGDARRTLDPVAAESTRPAGGRPATRSSSTSRCPAGSPGRRPRSTRSGAASRSSAARSSTPSRPPTSRPASTSRMSRLDAAAKARAVARPDLGPGVIGLSIYGDDRRRRTTRPRGDTLCTPGPTDRWRRCVSRYRAPTSPEPTPRPRD